MADDKPPQVHRVVCAEGHGRPSDPPLAETPVPPAQAAQPGESARRHLARMGGIASAAALAERIGAVEGSPVRARTVRARLRNSSGVRAQGAGWFALSRAPYTAVLPWAEARLRRAGGALEAATLVAEILQAWPHGSEAAVWAWLRQDPGMLDLRGGVVRLCEPRSWR